MNVMTICELQSGVVMSRIFIVYAFRRDKILPFDARNQLEVVMEYCRQTIHNKFEKRMRIALQVTHETQISTNN